MGQNPELTARELAKDLAVIGSVTCVERFDGWALLDAGVMFCFVDQNNTIYLRAGERTAARFADLGSTKHPDMPYWTLPAAAQEDVEMTRDLAYEAADIAHLALASPEEPNDTTITIESLPAPVVYVDTPPQSPTPGDAPQAFLASVPSGSSASMPGVRPASDWPG